VGEYENISGPEKTAQVFAMCTAKRVKEEQARRSIPPGASRARRTTCPKGTRVTGGGPVPTFGVRIVSSHPFDGRDRDRVPDDGWAARARNLMSFRGAVFVDANCLATKRGATRLRYRTSTSHSVYCPDDAHLTGGGIKHRASDSSVAWMNTSAPIDGTGDVDDIPDDFWYGRVPDYPRTVYAICLKEK
jgi:hypothetical protein